MGFCTNSRQQFSDFLLLIERTDLQEDEVLAQVVGRMARFDEWNEIVHAWTTQHATDEIIERAALLRIPVAPICNGDTVQRQEHLAARGVFRLTPPAEMEWLLNLHGMINRSDSRHLQMLGADARKGGVDPNAFIEPGFFDRLEDALKNS